MDWQAAWDTGVPLVLFMFAFIIVGGHFDPAIRRLKRELREQRKRPAGEKGGGNG